MGGGGGVGVRDVFSSSVILLVGEEIHLFISSDERENWKVRTATDTK